IVIPRRRSNGSESVWVVPASTAPSWSMTPESYSSRSVRVVLPASTCARIPKLSVFCDTRHIPWIGLKGHLDRRERLAHLPSLDDRRGTCCRNHRVISRWTAMQILWQSDRHDDGDLP